MLEEPAQRFEIITDLRKLHCYAQLLLWPARTICASGFAPHQLFGVRIGQVARQTAQRQATFRGDYLVFPSVFLCAGSHSAAEGQWPLLRLNQRLKQRYEPLAAERARTGSGHQNTPQTLIADAALIPSRRPDTHADGVLLLLAQTLPYRLPAGNADSFRNSD